MSAYQYADLALGHFHFAGQLALVFALVTIAYLFAIWCFAGRLGPGLTFVLHTLALGWQSNVAFLAVVTLRSGRLCLDESGDGVLQAGWAAAPWLIPGSAVLYGSVLLLCVAFAVACTRMQRRSSAA